jgi:hypothetical protein
MEELFFTYEGQQYSFNWRRTYEVDKYIHHIAIPDESELAEFTGQTFRMLENEDGVLIPLPFSSSVPETLLILKAIAGSIDKHLGR